MLPYRSKTVLRIEDYRVQPTDRPDWVAGTTRVPRTGEEVYCAAGLGVVAGLGGKTGDGSRLVHVTLPGAPRQPYLAAASNVLLPPLAPDVPAGTGTESAPEPVRDLGASEWLGVTDGGLGSDPMGNG